eukprot:gene15818-biopygen4408
MIACLQDGEKNSLVIKIADHPEVQFCDAVFRKYRYGNCATRRPAIEIMGTGDFDHRFHYKSVQFPEHMSRGVFATGIELESKLSIPREAGSALR